MTIVAVGDVVGLRDLALEQPGEYEDCTHNLRVLLGQLVNTHEGIEVLLFRDHFYVSAANLGQMAEVFGLLRQQIAQRMPFPLRAFIGPGELGATDVSEENSTKTSRLNGFVFGKDAVEVFGHLEGQKAACVGVSPRLTAAARKEGVRLLRNCFIPESGAARYEGFYDLALESDFLSKVELQVLLGRLLASRIAAAKVARFYIPLLVNWIRSTSFPGQAVDQLVPSSAFTRIKDVDGSELLVLTVVDRAFDGSWDTAALGNEEAKDRLETLKRHLTSKDWIARLVRGSRRGRSVPSYVLSPTSRRSFAVSAQA